MLETILKEGSKKKALDIVKKVIEDLKECRVPIKDLVIYTRLRKGIDSYDSKSPELAAVQKAIKRLQDARGAGGCDNRLCHNKARAARSRRRPSSRTSQRTTTRIITSATR